MSRGFLSKFPELFEEAINDEQAHRNKEVIHQALVYGDAVTLCVQKIPVRIRESYRKQYSANIAMVRRSGVYVNCAELFGDALLPFQLSKYNNNRWELHRTHQHNMYMYIYYIDLSQFKPALAAFRLLSESLPVDLASMILKYVVY